jgi:gliding motility-associated-like protein
VINIPAVPTTANAGPDQNLACGTTATTLAANAPSTGTGAWSIVSGTGGVIGSASSATSLFNGVAGQTYTLRWTITAGACSSTDNVVISIPAVPTTANAGTDQNVACNNTSTTLAANVPLTGSGAWSIISGTGGTIVTASSATSNFSGTAGQNYTLRWTITAGSCSSSDDVVINVPAVPTTANAGPDQTLACGTLSTALAANAATTGTGSWNIISGTGGTITTASSATSSFNGVAGQSYTLRWAITAGSCSSTDDVTINVPAVPTTANAGPDQNLACSTTATTLAANVPSTGTGAWSIISGTGGIIGNASSATSSFNGVAGQSYTLRWTITTSSCSITDDVVINVPAVPTTANAGPDQTLACGTLSTALSANTATTGTGSWNIISGTGGTIATASSATSSFNGVAGQSYTLRWTITAGSCSSTDDVVINIPAVPTTANAGPDQNLACSTTATTLAANVPSTGTGAWSIISGTGGTIAAVSSATSSFNGIAGQSYTLRWTITAGACSSTDNVVISIPAVPTTANAGPDQNLACSTTSTTLAANAASVGTGSWSIISGTGGTIATASSATSNFSGVAGQSYTLRWTITAGSCSSTDDVVINIPAVPTTANAGPDQNLACSTTATTLAANVPSTGTGAWSIVSGTGGTIATTSSATSSFNGIAGQSYTLRWTITTSSCSITDDVVINVPAVPTTANAGPDQTLACGTLSTTLSANTATTGTGSWSIISGTGGTIATASSATSNFAGVAGQSYTLRWTITAGSCSSTDDVTINVPAVPTTANAGPDQNLACGTFSAALSANTATSGTGAWSIISGTGGTIAAVSSATSSFSGVAGQSYMLRWTITAGSCSSTDDVMINIPTVPTVANAGPDQNLACSTTATTLAANVPSTGTGAWSIISGTGGTIAASSNPASAFSGTAGQSYTLRWTITTSSCSMTDDVVINVPAVPTTANAGADQSLACSTASTTLAANTAGVGTGAWSIISGTGGTIATASSGTSSFSGVAGQSYTLRWTITAGSCSSTDDVVINIPAVPTIANAGADQNLSCSTSSTTLAANVPSTGTGSWSILSGTGGTIATTSNATSSFNGVAGQSYTLRWMITAGSCSSADDVVINIPAVPTAANAGADQALACGTSTATLAGNAASVGTGAWSIISGIGGTVTTASSATSSFSGDAGQTYLLRWTITAAACSSADDVVISIPAVPTTANAGADQSLACSTSSTTLAANTASIGTGSWSIISGTGGSIALASSSTSSFSGAAGESYTLRWTIIAGSCESADEVVIDVPAVPTAADAGTDQNLSCNITSTVLEANTASIGTGSWSILSGNGGSIAAASSATSSFSGVAGQSYTLRWTISAGACSSTDDVVITVPAVPTVANAGADQDLSCYSTSTTLAADTATIGIGSWSIISGTGGTIASASNNASAFTGISGQNYLLAWSITEGACVSSDTLEIALPDVPAPANAGADQVLACYAGSTVLDASLFAAETGSWSIVSGNGGTVADATSDSSSFTGIPGEAYTLVWTASAGMCVSSDSVLISFPAIPSAANAGMDITPGCGVLSAALAADIPAAGTGTWTIISGNGGMLADSASASSGFTGLPGETYLLTWTVINGTCVSADSLSIVLEQIPTNASVGADQSLGCGDVTTILSANAAAQGSGLWSITAGNGGSFTDASLETTGFTGIPGESYTLTWTITSGNCSSADSMTITIPPSAVTIADAGSSQNGPGMCGVTSTSLSANIPVTGNASWSILSGNGGTIANAINPGTAFSGQAGETYVLQWMITDGVCTSADTVIIAFHEPASPALAGADSMLACGTTSLTLNANAAANGIGTWSIAGGIGGSFTDSSAAATTFAGIAGENYALAWTITDGLCSSADTVMISIPAEAEAATAGADQSLACGNVTALLSANVPAAGTGYWSISSITSGGSFADSTLASTTFTGNPGTAYDLAWTIVNGQCSSSDVVTISIPVSSVTIADAGPGQGGAALCGITASSLSANVAVNGNGSWTILSGNGGNIAAASSPTSGFMGIAGETYLLQWSITDGVCTSTDTVTIAFPAALSIASAGADQTTGCGITGTQLAANTAAAGTGSWSILSGNGGVLSDSSDANTTFSGNAGTTYLLQWLIGNGTCESADSVMISFPAVPVANAGNDQSLSCGVNATTLSANTVANGSWSILSGNGGSIISPSSESSAFTGVAAESYQLVWTVIIGSCLTTDTLSITFAPAIETANAGNDQSAACGTLSAILAATPAVAGTGSWSITSGNGGSFTDPSAAAATFQGTAGESYLLTWTITNGTCISSDTMTLSFQPGAIANAGNDLLLACGTTSTELVANAASGGSWSLVSGNGGLIADTTSAVSSFSGLAGESYTLLWTVTNGDCQSADTVTITVPAADCAGIPDDLFIPEGFSPNGDGVNDRFVIRGLGNYPANSLEIYNRWGNLVYKAEPYDNSWDGSNHFGLTIQGNQLPEGTYFYLLNLGDGSKVIRGYIYLTW